MGVHFNYQQKYRQNWFYMTVPLIAIIILVTFTNSVQHPYYEYLTSMSYSKVKAILVQVFDVIQTLISILISLSFIFLLRTIFKRFAALNSILMYACSFTLLWNY